MAIVRRYGEGEVKALAAKAGKAQAEQQQANIKLQQRFQKDMAMMDYQFKLAAEQRSRSWELEKMEIASRNDFALEEKRRVEKQNLFETKIQKIKDAIPQIGEDKANELILKARLEDLGIGERGMSEYERAMMDFRQRQLESTPEYQIAQRMKAAQEAKTTPAAGAVPGQPPVGGAAPQPAPVLGQAALKGAVPLKDVAPQDIPQDERGHFIVIDPESSKQYTVTSTELPSYIEQGFVTQPKTPAWWKQLTPFAGEKEEGGLASLGRGVQELFRGPTPEESAKMRQERADKEEAQRRYREKYGVN